MSKKEKARFLKRVMVYSLAMSTLVTLVALSICWIVKDISSGVLTPLCALWSIELSLGAWIKITEGKKLDKKEDNDVI